MKHFIAASAIFFCNISQAAPEPERVSVNAKALGMIVGAFCADIVDKAMQKASVPPEKVQETRQGAMEECVSYLLVGLQPVILKSI